ncbi:hypothetical protein AQJ67_37105 [Streptomyces caeruleatus]|uniref:Aminoglycoside phosphotransferase domain-containing protein n=1 Tax=Streptomyces caeruleatus TaxID=661399 RepID=A0A101TKH2_9ACTN|nr:hypothetical protein AQJ67_37105 [Streptomyces caeruleatus]
MQWTPEGPDQVLIAKVFEEAAARFSARPVGEPRLGWRGRTFGRLVERPGGKAWLRVVAAPAEKVPEKLWSGMATAQAVTGVRKPELMDVWETAEDGLRFRAELSTFVPESVCSATPELREPISLPDQWWRQFRSSLDAVAVTATDRVSVRQDLVTRRLTWVSDGTVPTEVKVFTASHGDMHWANVTSGTCVLLDWEGWGLGPAGFDAAMLHAYSLLVPEVAARVFETFADVLDTPSGRQTQLFAAAELLVMVGRGDHPELEGPLRRQVSGLLAAGGIG